MKRFTCSGFNFFFLVPEKKVSPFFYAINDSLNVFEYVIHTCRTNGANFLI